ncbi:5-azacytidine-induced protein 2 isoform 1-T2 [Mantella aurantiaca]
MDSLLDDDICILNHEKEDFTKRRDQDTPFSASSGEASVASHFALVTAYEDIKKRLKDTERENSTLKRRLRQMEEKLSGSFEEHSKEESDKVNRAYSAFREISIERDNLQNLLSAMEKDQMDSARHLNEQLQSKEVELLQVKSELETHQVMKSLSKTPTDWEIEKLNSELKIRSVEQELKLLQEECESLRAELQRTKNMTSDKSLFDDEFYQAKDNESEMSTRQAYWELKKEMSNLHLVTEVQAEVLRKLKGTVAATKKASGGLVQCEEDLERTCSRQNTSLVGPKTSWRLSETPAGIKATWRQDKVSGVSTWGPDASSPGLKDPSTQMISPVDIKAPSRRKSWRLSETPAGIRIPWRQDKASSVNTCGPDASSPFLKDPSTQILSPVDIEAPSRQKSWRLSETPAGVRIPWRQDKASGVNTCGPDALKAPSTQSISPFGVKFERAPYGSSSEHKHCDVSSAPHPHVVINTLQEKPGLGQWTDERPSPVGGRDCEESDSYQKFSFEENSWVMPSPPKPSETLFWETKNTSPSNTAHYYNQKYLFQS